jgi:hypothetical protein
MKMDLGYLLCRRDHNPETGWRFGVFPIFNDDLVGGLEHEFHFSIIY